MHYAASISAGALSFYERAAVSESKIVNHAIALLVPASSRGGVDSFRPRIEKRKNLQALHQKRN